MKAGFARLDITPPFGTNLVGYFHERPADGIITPLYVNAVALDDGENKAALVTIDAEGATEECTNIIRDYVSQTTGLDPDAVFISCVHCHQAIGLYGMSNFNHIVKTRVADAVRIALGDLKEAKAHIARGKAEGISFIRLYKLKDGGTKTNPGLKSAPDILGPLGTPDETVQLVKLTREDAPDIAIVQFQTHPDVIGGTKICHDWPGFVRTFLEKALTDEADGKGVKAICFNGAQGDTNHINFTRITEGIIERRGGVSHSKHMARVIVGEVLGMYTYAEEVSSDKVFFKRQPVIIDGTKKPTPEQVEMGRQMMQLYNDAAKKAKEEGRNEGEAGAAAVKDFPINITMARKYVGLANAPDKYTLHLSSVGFGDVAFVGFPGEPFTEIGRQTKANSPFKMTFPCCMTNGQSGYFPTKNVFGDVNGYEATATKFAVGTAERLTDAAIELTKELYIGNKEN